VRANITYYIAVDGFDGASGDVYLGYTFTPATVYTLTINTNGNGGVTPSSGDAASNSTVVLTATPDQFFEFVNWDGSFFASANPLSVVVNSNISLAAYFRLIDYTDGFETGNLSRLGWASAGTLPWVVESTNVLAGGFSARSGQIANGQTSSLLLTTNFFAGPASFYLKVSSEPTWDLLQFYVDGTLLQQWSGEVDWQIYPFDLASGIHTLEWRYTKDQTSSAGLDAAFIDNVLLPISLPTDSSTPASLQIVRQADGSCIITVHGQTNRQYVIQGGTAMGQLGSWQNLYTNIAANGVIHYVDPATGSHSIRYYRAIAQ
jgi:hypothetical protein